MHNHGPVNLEEMALQYRGKTLPDLLVLHLKTMPKEVLPQILRGTFMAFVRAQHKQMDEFTDTYLQNWLEPHVPAMNLGNLLTVTISDMQRLCAEADIMLDDSRLFDLFHIMVLKLALRSYNEPDIREKAGLNGQPV